MEDLAAEVAAEAVLEAEASGAVLAAAVSVEAVPEAAGRVYTQWKIFSF